ncbi:MAG: carcinine hydrolase/isopenicillin-N N-acyltransferase family protein, partial [Planctomycetota bacterium]|nr:carcinine hydrolase/isopenicillin-N N-acyltransferase family protein [Planctomycetota bacterium]
MKLIRTLLTASILCLPAIPCSAFLVVGSGEVLFANNEDYWTPDTRVWFEPAADGKHGVMYLGYSNGFPQGGMNDAGLAFDGFATKSKPLRKQKGKKRHRGNPINEVMESCATVDEVVAFLEKVDLRPLMTSAMLMFADASGDSVIIEGDRFIRKSGEYQVITNFYQSEQEDDAGQCPRFDAATRVLKARKATTVESCAEALSAAAQRGSKVATLYSNVFDLKKRTATLWLFHDFETSVVLDLKAELAKGKRTLNLPDLFPANKAFDKYVEARSVSVEKRIEQRRGPALSAEAMKQLEGSYEVEYKGEKHAITM